MACKSSKKMSSMKMAMQSTKKMAMGGTVGTGGMKSPNKAASCNAVNQ